MKDQCSHPVRWVGMEMWECVTTREVVLMSLLFPWGLGPGLQDFHWIGVSTPPYQVVNLKAFPGVSEMQMFEPVHVFQASVVVAISVFSTLGLGFCFCGSAGKGNAE